MGLQITAMIVGLLLIAGAWVGGVNRLHEDYGTAVQGHEQLRQIYRAGARLTTAQTLLFEPQPNGTSAVAQIQRAITEFEAVEPWQGEWAESYGDVLHSLHAAMADVRMWQRVGGVPRMGKLGDALNLISDVDASIRERVTGIEQAAREKRRKTLTAAGTLSGIVILAAVLLGLWQYRSVMNPLGRLGGAVRRVARGQFGVRILESGMPSGDDNEFARLAADFNRMADQLDGFYKDLEQKVSEKSKELIRSERLASVGYLAAGVAHEINNPLGIISGYAEYALSELKGGKPTAATDIDGTLKVIRDEAFRCKDITAKLLSLARPGDSQRHPVNLAETAEQVVSILGGLRDFKDRTITVRAESREDPLVVNAVEGEMKQVLMNLLINALEATDDGTGEVKVTVTLDAEHHVTLTVSDNGRGMSAETLERVFEPFFTERPRSPDSPPRPGTGLGLSITHAIIQSHGGRITAHSDGPGLGSRFVIELPAADVAQTV